MSKQKRGKPTVMSVTKRFDTDVSEPNNTGVLQMAMKLSQHPPKLTGFPLGLYVPTLPNKQSKGTVHILSPWL